MTETQEYERMKDLERATKTTLPTKTNMVLRMDGRNFSRFTKGMMRPFDPDFAAGMDETAMRLCREIPGSVLAYVQSDEISVVAVDYRNAGSQQWFDGSVQKIVSTAAAFTTANFNDAYVHPQGRGPAMFDARVFTIDDDREVADYLAQRQADAHRNAITMAAGVHFSHTQLLGKNTSQKVTMMAQAGMDIDSLPEQFLYGRYIIPTTQKARVSYVHKATGERCVVEDVERKVWTAVVAPNFIAHPENVLRYLPARAIDTASAAR